MRYSAIASAMIISTKMKPKKVLIGSNGSLRKSNAIMWYSQLSEPQRRSANLSAKRPDSRIPGQSNQGAHSSPKSGQPQAKTISRRYTLMGLIRLPYPHRLAEKLLAIRKDLGLSQNQMLR